MPGGASGSTHAGDCAPWLLERSRTGALRGLLRAPRARLANGGRHAYVAFAIPLITLVTLVIVDAIGAGFLVSLVVLLVLSVG